MIQSPPDPLRPTVEAIRKVGVVLHVRMQMSPYVDHLLRAIVLGVEHALERPRLVLGVPRRLVPVRLRVREIYSTTKPGQHHTPIHFHGTGGTSALRGDPNGVKALHKAQHRAFLSSNPARGRPEAIAAILHLHQPKDKLKNTHQLRSERRSGLPSIPPVSSRPDPGCRPRNACSTPSWRQVSRMRAVTVSPHL